MPEINLNADLGEGFGAYKMGNDAALLSIVKSANIACGFHAGDPVVMTDAVLEARNQGVSIGAHPSFHDLQGFGRRPMHLSAKELAAMLTYQLGALAGIAAASGHRITHVKPHGALNNMAAENLDLAIQVAGAIKAFDASLIFLVPCLSKMVEAGESVGLRVAQEAFADRAYTDQGHLVSRSQPDAMIRGSEASLQHVLRMLDAGGLIALSGKVLRCDIHSICVHGDEPSAVAAATEVRNGLERSGYAVKPLSEMPF